MECIVECCILIIINLCRACVELLVLALVNLLGYICCCDRNHSGRLIDHDPEQGLLQNQGQCGQPAQLLNASD